MGSIAEAIAKETDETLGTTDEQEEVGTDVVSEDDDTVVREDDESEDDSYDESDEDDDVSEEDDESEGDDWETDPDDEEQELVTQEAEEEEGEGVDPLENLTAEEIQQINSDPRLKKLKRAIMRGYNEKVKQDAELIQLGAAYKRDPIAVVETLARANGLTLQQAQAVAEAGVRAGQQVQRQTGNALEEAGKELESLFGEKIGPRVRSVFEKWADARFGDALMPVQQVVGQLTSQQEAQRMMSEEQAFKKRHAQYLTPQLEKAVIELGSSGKVIPGDNMTPAEYLDTLLDIAIAKQVKAEGMNANRDAAKKLAKRVKRNLASEEPRGVSSKVRMSKKSRVGEAQSISEALDIADAELSSEDF